jgi:primase-polymerase (primpol)-like protein
MSRARPPHPDALDLKPTAVPDELREREQWVAWRYEFDDDRDEWTKVPIQVPAAPRGRAGYASSTDPETWTTFENAVEHHERDETDTDGVGFVVHDEGIVVGVDLDDCRDPDTGDLEEWAVELLETDLCRSIPERDRPPALRARLRPGRRQPR